MSAAQEVKRIVRAKEIQQYLINKGVTWEFIIEKAPWQGGFWERMVGITKRCLKKAVGRESLSFEEMRTVLIEIEATLNNQPMTYLYDDEQGISYPLTLSSLSTAERSPPRRTTSNLKSVALISPLHEDRNTIDVC